MCSTLSAGALDFWPRWPFPLAPSLAIALGLLPMLLPTRAIASASSTPISSALSHKQVEVNLPPLDGQAPSINIELEQEPPPQLELDDFEFWAEQCQQLVQAQQYEEGLKACNEAIAIDDTGDRTVPVWAARAEALIYQGQYTDALISLEDVLAEDDTNSLLITQQCVAYVHSGQYEDAVDSCETALMVNGNWGARSPAFAWYYRGIALQEQGFLETSLWSFERAVRGAGGAEAPPSTSTEAPPSTSTEAPQASTSAESSASGFISADELFADRPTPTPAAADNGDNDNGDNIETSSEDLLPSLEELLAGTTSPEPLGHAEWCHTLHLLGEHRDTFADRSSLDPCDLDDAIAYYEQAANLHPQDIILWLRQGYTLEQLGDYARALAAYEQGLMVAAEHPQLLARQCSMLNQLRRYEEALAACELALESTQPQSPGDRAYSLNQYSVALIGQERYEEALAAAERAIATLPTYGPAYTSKTVSLWHLERNPEALAIAQRALTIYANQEAAFADTFYRPNAQPWPLFYRDYGVAYFNWGRVLASTRQQPSIHAPLTSSIDVDPVVAAYDTSLRLPIRQLETHWPSRLLQPDQDRLATEERSLADLAQGLFPPVSTQQTLATLTPNRFVDTLLNLSAVLLSKHPLDSLRLAQIATTLDPESFIGWYNMGLAAQKLQEYYMSLVAQDIQVASSSREATRYAEIAKYAFSVAQQINPEHPHVQLGIANALLTQGQIEEAIAHYTQILTQDPSSAPAKEGLMRLGYRSDRQEAIAIFMHILVFDPTYIPAKLAMLNIGDDFLEEGNRGEAIAVYDQVLNIDANYRPAQIARAAALQPSTP